jgi:hypothetical protein
MSHSKDPVSDSKDFEQLKIEIYKKMNIEDSSKNEQNALKNRAKQEVAILQDLFNKNDTVETIFDESILINELIDFSKKKDK